MICPFMSCREEEFIQPEDRNFVECQEKACAIYDRADKVCGILGVKMQLVKVEESYGR